ncbi:hypothetical protein [Ectobacillus sp. sgz5001026]|uniref:hypothetical protein n=1 Tax=Ectobacillus sp. sgz5001026 TaxID=3242473 RepID=UPI0036D42F12
MKDIPIFLELLSLFGLICCLFIFNASLAFLIILVSFVSCEIFMEWLQLKLASWLSITYKLSYIIAVGIVAIKENGLHMSSMFAVFFIAILLIIPNQSSIVETTRG